MNLKRLRGIYAVALITIAAAFIAGCSNSMAGSVDSGTNARMATLSLSATGIPNDYAEQFAKSYPTARNVAARSITPDDPFDISKSDSTDGIGQSKGLVFKLSGRSETGKVQNEMVVTIKADSPTRTDDDTGNPVYVFNGDVTLDAMSWNLKLVAYKGTDAVLQGFCSVDLRTGSGTAKFTMGTEGLTANGTVNITGKFVDEDEAAKFYTMGIYRKDTGELVTGTLKSATPSPVDANKESDFTYDNITIDPGTYLYTMIFYAGTDATTNIVGSFTDTLVVDPGNDLTRTLKIDVIGRKPTKPEHLMAYLVNDSEGKDGSPTYNVKVEWTKSTYATNYELQVLEYTGTDGNFALTTYDTSDAPTNTSWTSTIYGMKSMNSAAKDFVGSAVYGTNLGTSYIMFGETSCSLLLETEKIYEIRLRGRNYIGASDFAEREESADDTGLTGFGVAADGAGTDHINRLLVTYHLNGGTLDKQVGDNNTIRENTYAEYKSWKPSLDYTNTELVKHDGTIYKIQNGLSIFDSWLFEKGEGAQIQDDHTLKTINSATPNASKESVTNFTYKNLTVLASYGNKVTADISMGAALKDIDPEKISVSVTGGTVSNSLLTETAGDITLYKYTVTKTTDGSDNMLKIVLDGESGNSVYKDVSFTLIDAQNKQKTLPVKDGTDRTCEIDLTNYPTGKIQVMVSAVTNKTTTVSQTLMFDLQ